MRPSPVRVFASLRAVASLVVLFAAGIAPALAQDFAGRLSLIDAQVAKDIGLSDAEMAKVQEFIDGRLKEANDMVASVKSKPKAEQDAKLAEFTAESDRRGQELLTDAQKGKLNKIRIAKLGMPGVVEPDIAEQLKLDQKTRDEIAKQVDEYKGVLAKGSDSQKRMARAFYQQKIAGMLSDEQKKTWEALSGVPVVSPSAPAASAAPGSVAAASAGGSRTSDNSGELVVGADGRMTIKFQYTPWKDVIEYFAKQAGYSLISEPTVPGVFNYPTDTRKHTPEKVLDILNTALLTQKGFLLVKSDQMLILFDVSQGPIPPEFVKIIPPDELAGKGDFELVRVQFDITKYSPDEAALEVRPVLGPYGTVQVLPKAQQLIVTELAGKMRAIKRTIDAMQGETVGGIKTVLIRLKKLMPTEFMAMARVQLGIPEGQFFTPDGSVRITADELGRRLLVTGKPLLVEKVQEMVKLLEDDTVTEGPTTDVPPLEVPQFVVYAIKRADPALVHLVASTLLAGTPDARMQVDPVSKTLSVLARPATHATVRGILAEMEGEGKIIEVFKVRKSDPAALVLSINKLFGAPVDTSSRNPAPVNSFRVDSDSVNMLLTVNGTKAEVDQIRDYLVRLGEILPTSGSGVPGGVAGVGALDRSPYRLMQIGGTSGQAALEKAVRFWEATRPNNRIRVVGSESDEPVEQAAGGSPAAQPAGPLAPPPGRVPGAPMPPAGSAPPMPPARPTSGSVTDSWTESPLKYYFVSEPAPQPQQPAEPPLPAAPVAGEQPPAADAPQEGAPAEAAIPPAAAALAAPASSPTPRPAGRCGRRCTWWPSASRCRRPAPAGA